MARPLSRVGSASKLTPERLLALLVERDGDVAPLFICSLADDQKSGDKSKGKESPVEGYPLGYRKPFFLACVEGVLFNHFGLLYAVSAKCPPDPFLTAMAVAALGRAQSGFGPQPIDMPRI